MMYSSKTQGFYPSDKEGQMPYIEAGSLPDDLVEISDEDYAAWVNPPDGKCSAWVDGRPVVTVLPSVDYVALARDKRKELEAAASAATYTLSLKLQMGRKLTAAETAKVNAWLDYSDALAATDLSDAPDIKWPPEPTL